jgi:hypothetical protein
MDRWLAAVAAPVLVAPAAAAVCTTLRVGDRDVAAGASPAVRPAGRRSDVTTTTSIDGDRLEHLMHAIVGDLGATMNAALVRIGDKLGLYRALAANGPLSPAQLAERTGTAERYVREWLGPRPPAGTWSTSPRPVATR